MRWLFEGRHVSVGRWTCGVQTSALSTTRTSAWYKILFLNRGAFQIHSAGKSALIDRSGVLIHPPGPEFRTSHPVGYGDAGIFLALSPAAIEEAIGGAQFETLMMAGLPFRVSHSVDASRAYFRLRMLIERATRDGSDVSLDLVDVARNLVRRLLTAAASPSKDMNPEVRARQRNTVESAKLLLTTSFRRSQQLADVARAVSVSPCFLCRVFRRETGTSLHRYVQLLRLRSAFNRILGGADLAQVALESGFSSHSYFTFTFRREFGVPPSVVRDVLAGHVQDCAHRRLSE